MCEYIWPGDGEQILFEMKKMLTSDFLCETSVSTNMVAEITTWQVVHYQVEILSVLKGVVHVDDEGILQLCQDLALIDHGLDTAFCYYSCLAHFFHGKVLLGLFSLDSPYFAEATLTDAKVVYKVGFWYGYNKVNRNSSLVWLNYDYTFTGLPYRWWNMKKKKRLEREIRRATDGSDSMGSSIEF